MVKSQGVSRHRTGKAGQENNNVKEDGTYLGFFVAESGWTLPARKAGLKSEGPWNFLGGWSMARTSQARQFLDLT